MSVIIRRSTGLANNREWDEWATLLDSVIYDSEAQRNKYDDIVSALTIEKSSKRWGEKSITMGGLGDFQAKTEGAAATQDDYEQGYEKFVEHGTFALEVEISKELKDDNMLDTAKQKTINLVQAYKRTRARLTTQAITGAVGSATSISFNGATIDITTGDGLALFNEAHTLKSVVGTTQCNFFSDVLGSTTVVLNKASNKMRNFKDDKGNVLGFMPDTVVLPGNDPEYEDFVKRVIGSDGEVGTNNNDINTQRGKWKFVVDPEWTPTISSTNHPVILLSSEAMKTLQGTKFYDRTKLDIMTDVDVHSRNLTYNGFARMSITHPNWRHVMMIGSSDSSTAL
ncbi:MAG: hypothetical protein IKV25_01210 [Clostridia bacterium]|nr:hypothetical protein [Bacteroidaceae bacterium]MBR4794790.1 hypothetical protein [Bacteroidaceae bacterium]MBR5245972.1 hypothetical protein [Clostridia bacterium]